MEKLFQSMLSYNILPDTYTYLTIIQAYTKSDKLSEAEEIINSMHKQGVMPSCSHFRYLLSAYAEMGLIGEAERVYNGISKGGLSPDLACYRTMLKGYLDYGHVEKGINFFEDISKTAKSDSFILSAAVHLYKFLGKELEAENVLKALKQQRIHFLEGLKIGLKSKMPQHV